MKETKTAEEIRLAIKEKFGELTQCVVVSVEILNALLQEKLVTQSEYNHLNELSVSIVFCICILAWIHTFVQLFITGFLGIYCESAGLQTRLATFWELYAMIVPILDDDGLTTFIKALNSFGQFRALEIIRDHQPKDDHIYLKVKSRVLQCKQPSWLHQNPTN